jgi:hypothetical protein
LLALVSFSRDAGDVAAANGYAEQLARVAPGERGLAGCKLCGRSASPNGSRRQDRTSHHSLSSDSPLYP